MTQPSPHDSLAISFAATAPEKADAVIIPVSLERGLPVDPASAGLDVALIHAFLESEAGFKGKAGDTAVLPLPGNGRFRHAILFGIGDAVAWSALELEVAGGKLYQVLKNLGAKKSVLLFAANHDRAGIATGDAVALVASGLKLRSYQFDTYRTKKKDDEKPLPDSVVVAAGIAAEIAKKRYEAQAAVAAGVFFARDLVSEPPNVLYPESFANFVKEKFRKTGVVVTIHDEKWMERKGFGAFLAVGMGSEQKPRYVTLEYNGLGRGVKDSKPIAFVGKGITFDTGGVCIKPAAAMEEMKSDMAGAAAVAGAIYALAAAGAKVHVVGALALAENMSSHNAYRPADIVKTMSGQTVEVINTDAEGRLVLCDAMWHVQEEFAPSVMVDLATLTGAARIALGEEYAGLFANTDDLSDDLIASSKATGEKIWRLPLDDAFDRQMDSQWADMRNTGANGLGGSCTAAAFLQRFVKPGLSWAHLDIAPVALWKADKPLYPKGASGFGVRLLHAYAMKKQAEG